MPTGLRQLVSGTKKSRAIALLKINAIASGVYFLRIFEAVAAPLALAILPRLGPVGQRLPNAKAISYSIFLSHGKSLLSPIASLPNALSAP